MDIKESLDYRFKRYKYYTVNMGIQKYDYEREGILRRCLPKILFKGNPILVTFLLLIDLRIIMTLKYIDKLKKFKWISQY